ncbi:MAG: hypothetical protein AAGJ08_26370 [Cyanobacteria bacterium P01_H01_bin.35]
MSNLTVKDLEMLQGTLNQAGLDYQLELEEGKIKMYFLINEPKFINSKFFKKLAFADNFSINYRPDCNSNYYLDN